MAKGNFWNDTFEQLAELGQSTAKKSASSVVKTFNPLQVFDNNSEKTSTDEPQNKAKQKELDKKNNHTQLDFDKLGRQYQTQEKQKESELRKRLFDLVKNEEQELLMRSKQEKEQKQKLEQQEEEKKKRDEEEKKKNLEQDTTPKGKERKSILAPKKRVTQEKHAEYKPSSGKS